MTGAITSKPEEERGEEQGDTGPVVNETDDDRVEGVVDASFRNIMTCIHQSCSNTDITI